MCVQVHRAVSRDGEQLAVKIQHAGLRDTYQADTVIVEAVVQAVRWFFPDFNYQWLVDELKDSLPKVRDLRALDCSTPCHRVCNREGSGTCSIMAVS